MAPDSVHSSGSGALAVSACDEDLLFSRIAEDLITKSWSVIPNALPSALCALLAGQLKVSDGADFSAAGIGRGSMHTLKPAVRRDEIRWIEGATTAERAWLDWSRRLQSTLNRRLYLGLFSFESHFAHYRPGAFYRKHVDAFKAAPVQDDTSTSGSNRVLSLVAYFNSHWQPDDGGELVLYDAQGDTEIIRVIPELGTLVIFLSEEVPHEVLPTQRDRYSIAGWYRVNQS
ncbi:MAG: 2OG-Fe(II) oxygenase [Pseudomonadota bacterium]